MRQVFSWLAIAAMGLVIGCESNGPGIDDPPSPGGVTAAPSTPEKLKRGERKLLPSKGGISITPKAK